MAVAAGDFDGDKYVKSSCDNEKTNMKSVKVFVFGDCFRLYEIVVGAPYFSESIPSTGKVYVYSGKVWKLYDSLNSYM